LDDLLKAVVRREVDQVCVWSIDRLGRSLRDLINVLEELRQKGCELYVHKQAIDTNTPSGKMLFQMLGVFAEFEREIMRERIIAGQPRARAQGKRIGRRSVIDESLQARVARLRSDGLSLRDIGGRLNVSAATVLKALSAG
jgi:DNA invertase Pin-like site-specific DNA recombinase